MKYNLSDQVDQQKAIARFKKLLDDKKKIELKEVKPRRTISQNSYLHVCITLYAIEIGLRVEEAKTQLKRICPFMRYEMTDKKGNSHIFLKQTSIMTTKEMTDFIEWIRNHAVTELGAYIPTADEYKERRETIDRTIDQNKEHL